MTSIYAFKSSLRVGTLSQLHVGFLELANLRYFLALPGFVVLDELLNLFELSADQIDTPVYGLATFLQRLRYEHRPRELIDASVFVIAVITFPKQIKLLLHQIVFILLFDDAGAISNQLLMRLMQLVVELDLLLDLLFQFLRLCAHVPGNIIHSITPPNDNLLESANSCNNDVE